MTNNKKLYLYKLSSKAINYSIDKNEKNVLYLNKYLREYNNKGTKLQNSNMMNSWNNQLYKFNKNELINTLLLDRLVSKLLVKLFIIKEIGINNSSTILKGSQAKRRIFINKPKFKHTINTVYINFNYNDTNMKIINNKHTLYYGSLIKDINNILGCLNINNNNNELFNITTYLSGLYNKKVIIIPNKIKYNYNDNVIFNSSISYDLDKYKGGLAGKTYSKLLRDNIPMNNSLNIKNNYITNIINNNNIKYNNIISNNSLNIKDIYKSFDINKITNELLVNKYLIGLSILFKGKNIKKAGVSRSIKEKLLFGSLSNKLYRKNSGLLVYKNNNNTTKYLNFDININKKYKLNYIPNHHAISQLSKVNKAKTGVYGISVKLNTI
uniref:Ribosomal protein S3 n=1 Tax=Cyberlindnera suaveolens TaxID=907738 RepID=S5U4Y5_9ASCO|nr:ribosomal protein S3 [Cyberlindnera suaveolens]AGS44428.1 ribosomal protein S3 [Cyberlindnera suaveolens]